MTSDVSLIETAKAAEFFLSDGLIITGSATGRAIDNQELQEVYTNAQQPVITGSGVSAENLAGYWPYADAFIVGSSLKQDGLWSNPIDEKRVNNLIQARQNLL